MYSGSEDKEMTNEELGKAYEFYVLSGRVSLAAVVISSTETRLRRENDNDLASQLKEIRERGGQDWTYNAIQLIPYSLLGEMVSDGELDPMTRSGNFKKWFTEREAAIEAGSFEGREEKQALSYQERKEALRTELFADALAACKRNGIKDADIFFENIPMEDRDDFVRRNGSNQMVIMEPGSNDGKSGETFGVCITNRQGAIIKNLLGREGTITLSDKE